MEKRDIGQRLRETRKALGFKDRPTFLRRLYPQMGEAEIEEARDRLEQWERGTAYPSRQFVRDLKRWKGVTFDWVFDDDMRSLPADVYEAVTKRRKGDAA